MIDLLLARRARPVPAADDRSRQRADAARSAVARGRPRQHRRASTSTLERARRSTARSTNVRRHRQRRPARRSDGDGRRSGVPDRRPDHRQHGSGRRHRDPWHRRDHRPTSSTSRSPPSSRTVAGTSACSTPLAEQLRSEIDPTSDIPFEGIGADGADSPEAAVRPDARSHRGARPGRHDPSCSIPVRRRRCSATPRSSSTKHRRALDDARRFELAITDREFHVEGDGDQRTVCPRRAHDRAAPATTSSGEQHSFRDPNRAATAPTPRSTTSCSTSASATRRRSPRSTSSSPRSPAVAAFVDSLGQALVRHRADRHRDASSSTERGSSAPRRPYTEAILAVLRALDRAGDRRADRARRARGRRVPRQHLRWLGERGVRRATPTTSTTTTAVRRLARRLRQRCPTDRRRRPVETTSDASADASGRHRLGALLRRARRRRRHGLLPASTSPPARSTRPSSRSRCASPSAATPR